MKKMPVIILMAFVGVILISSCKTRENCPAYGYHTQALKAAHS